MFLKENIGCCEACPIFFQFVTDYIMERLIKQKTYSFIEDVLFYWSMVSVNWEEEESTELLQKIIEQ